MELIAHESALNEDPSSKLLIGYLNNLGDELDFSISYIYHKFPVSLSETSEPQNVDVLFISKNYGVFLFRCLDASERTIDWNFLYEAGNELEDIYSSIYSKLLKSKLLREKRSLNTDIVPIIFFSNSEFNISVHNCEWPELSFVNDFSSLKKTITKNKNSIESEKLKEIRAIIEGSKILAIKSERFFNNSAADTKGRIIERVEAEIANFDSEQKRAGFIIIDGPQRIRGLAGSGKTIILAMKAAYIHFHEPNAKIVYTYSTKSLKEFVKNLITKFYRHITGIDPNWEKINIMHAWGGKNLEGLYHETCLDNSISPKSFYEMKDFGKMAFNEACKLLEAENLKKTYDYILIDEAQDFPIYFYRVCRKIVKNNRVIWAYDECQNILSVELQNTVETFGKDPSGNPYIDFDNNSIEGQDLVLHKCYRNPRKTLVSAFALGMGICSEIVQLPESKDLWEDWGFKIVSGNYKKNELIEIVRPEENSPLMKNKLLDSTEDIIKFNYFESFSEECSYVVENIVKDLSQDLRPEDIMVISLDDKYARKYFQKISEMLNENSISSFNLLDAPSFNTQFKMKDNVTLTTVYRAKGNEAPQVYIIGVDRVFVEKNSPLARNKIFTAMTRAKAWVSITGIRQTAKDFCDELEKIIKNDFKLKFIMPDLVSLKVFQRNLKNKQAAFIAFNRFIETKARQLGLDEETLRNSFLEEYMKQEDENELK